MNRGLLALLLASGLSWSEILVNGVVRNDSDEKSLTKVKIHLPSGKALGETDRDGRFEFTLPSDKMTLVFEKPGFESRTILLSELKDLMNAEIFLHSTLQSIDTVQTIAQRAPTRKLLTGPYQDLAIFEKTAGMRLDLTEQIAQIPGMSGQQDFSGKLSYLGSRPGELSLDYQGMELPWPQHLDFGFPGNLSGLSPKLVGRYKVDRAASSSVNQAGSLSLVPLKLPNKDWDVDLSAGNAVYDGLVAIPLSDHSAMAMDFRWLNPTVLKNLGQKFFSENRRQGSECAGADCDKYGNEYELSAMDAFAYYRTQDSTGAQFSVMGMWLQDSYSIEQDTTRSFLGDGAKLVKIFGGSQTLWSGGFLSQSSTGGSWGAQWSKSSKEALQRDTTKTHLGSSGHIVSDSALLFSQVQEDQKVKLNKTWEFEGGDELRSNLSWISESKSDSLLLKPLNLDRDLFDASLIYASTTKTSGQQREWNAGVVGRSDRAIPGGLLRYRQQFSDSVRLFALEGSASSKAWDVYKGSEDPQAQWEQNLLGLVEYKMTGSNYSLALQPYARYMVNPEMPSGDWILWKESQLRDAAWVAGGSIDFDYTMGSSLRFKSQWSHVSGEFTGGAKLAWSENRLLEQQTRLRYFPLMDTTFSLILSHRVSLAKPLYSYELDAVNLEKTTLDLDQTVDLYRTDLRVELDLPSRYLPLKRGRLFLEVDNLFADLESDALKFLGSQNVRQRGWTVDRSTASSRLVPYIARGQGMFLMFGVDASLGF